LQSLLDLSHGKLLLGRELDDRQMEFVDGMVLGEGYSRLSIFRRDHVRSSIVVRICRISSRSRRRSALASWEWKPPRQLPLRSPRGAPGDLPPWVLHRPFGMAGPSQIVPRRVLAPHRG